MWPRICEIILGIWLIMCHFLFPFADWIGIGSAILIFLFAGLSFIESINKIHLLQIIPAGMLFYASYSFPTSNLPIVLQNNILVGLSLLVFAIIPTKACEPPRPWKKFYD